MFCQMYFDNAAIHFVINKTNLFLNSKMNHYLCGLKSETQLN